MALFDYSSANCILYVNGRRVDQWGLTETPVTITQLRDSSQLQQGWGGSALVFTVPNEGYELQISVLPGSDDSKFLNRVMNNELGDIYANYTTISTDESYTLAEGVAVKRGDLSRGGPSISDDVYTFHFNTGSVAK